MQKNYQAQIPIGHKLAQLLSVILFTGSLLLCNSASAKFRFDKSDGDTAEKKVDYLEQIYFSHKNKEDLNLMILTTIQQLDGKSATLSVAKQYAFLTGIKATAEQAKNSCDIEEMLAAGIYNIDANEAIQQEIPRPNDKTGISAQQALNAVNQVSTSATQAAWSGWYLSNGSISGFGAANKIAGATGKINAAAGVLSTAGKAIKFVKDIFDKDKPCKNVPQKEIALGEHKAPPAPTDVKTEVKPEATAQLPVIAAPAPNTSTTKLTVKSITFNQMNTLKSAIEKIMSVTAVSTVGFSENIAIISVASNIKSDELATKVLEAGKPLILEVAGLAPQEITLVKK